MKEAPVVSAYVATLCSVGLLSLAPAPAGHPRSPLPIHLEILGQKVPEISTWRQELQVYIFYWQNCKMLKFSKPSSFHNLSILEPHLDPHYLQDWLQRPRPPLCLHPDSPGSFRVTPHHGIPRVAALECNHRRDHKSL